MAFNKKRRDEYRQIFEYLTQRSIVEVFVSYLKKWEVQVIPHQNHEKNEIRFSTSTGSSLYHRPFAPPEMKYRKDYQDRIESFKLRRKDADNKISHNKRIVIRAFIGLIILYIILGLIIWFHQGNNDILELYQFILPTCGILVSYLYFALWGRTLNFIHWLENYNTYNQNKYYKIYDCIPSSMEKATGELEIIEQRKQQADDELHSLNQRLMAFEQEMRDLAS